MEEKGTLSRTTNVHDSKGAQATSLIGVRIGVHTSTTTMYLVRSLLSRYVNGENIIAGIRFGLVQSCSLELKAVCRVCLRRAGAGIAQSIAGTQCATIRSLTKTQEGRLGDAGFTKPLHTPGLPRTIVNGSRIFGWKIAFA